MTKQKHLTFKHTKIDPMEDFKGAVLEILEERGCCHTVYMCRSCGKEHCDTHIHDHGCRKEPNEIQ